LAARAVLSADAGLLVITANMQSETGFPSSHQLKFYVASKSRLKLAARAVQSADSGLLVQVVSQDEENVKVTHRRLEQGAALHCLSQQLPGTQQDTGCHLGPTADAPRNKIAPSCHLVCT